jgi:type IV pilus assembly protein PilA
MLMLQRLQRRLQGEREGGFTLIELMVVVLIIAILIAIAIPTFLGARQRAQDRAAQSNLRNGLTAEKTFYTDNQAYTATVATLEGIEAPLDWRADAAPAVNGAVYVAINVAADQVTLGGAERVGDLLLHPRHRHRSHRGYHLPAGGLCGPELVRGRSLAADQLVIVRRWEAGRPHGGPASSHLWTAGRCPARGR